MSDATERQCQSSWTSDPTHACTAQAVESSEHCLAHHPDRASLVLQYFKTGQQIDLKKGEVDSELVTLITVTNKGLQNRPVNASFAQATFTGKASFEGATFSGDASFAGATFSGDASFAGATFTGYASFQEATFIGSAWFAGATFTGDASFGEAIFTGKATFERATINGAARFARATFNSDAWFAGATFAGDASFEKTTFGKVWFSRATFTGEPWFGSATFTGDAAFGAATFTRDAWFTGATFSACAWFAAATFTGNISFGKSTGKGRIELTRIRLLGYHPTINLGDVATHIQGTTVDRPVTITADVATTSLRAIAGCVLTQQLVIGVRVALTETLFAGTVGIDQIRFTANPRWPTKQRQIMHGRFVRRLAIADELNSDDRIGDDSLELLYRQLRHSLEASKAHAAANDFFYGELEARRRGSRRRSWERTLLTVYRDLFGYGVKAWIPAFWWLAVTSGLTVAFTTRGDELIEPNAADGGLNIHHWGQAFAFVLQNSTNVLRTIEGGLEWDGAIYLAAGRFTTIALIAGVILALRARVARSPS